MNDQRHDLRLILVSDDLSSNSLGRAWSLAKLADALGWTYKVLAATGSEVWPPLTNTPFAQKCETYTDDWLERAKDNPPDLILCVKPLPESFFLSRRMSSELGVPLIVDIDDPDIEAQLSWSKPVRRLAKELLRPRRMRDFKRIRSTVLESPTMVSNPSLQRTYGGAVVPHVRDDPGVGSFSSRESHVRVSFVGTNRGHKGVSKLREAVSRLRQLNFVLTVTDDAPIDAKPWENWTGHTSIEGGLQIVRDSDIIVIPSEETQFSGGQLPAKLMDAMLAGRAVIASDLPPIRWALGDTGVLIRPGATNELQSAIVSLRDPRRRRELGEAARQRSIEMFSVESVAPIFEQACLAAVNASRASAA